MIIVRGNMDQKKLSPLRMLHHRGRHSRLNSPAA
jgi:hypothetical protein